MKRILHMTLIAAVLLPAIGCRRTAIREGIWELSFQLHFSQTGEKLEGAIPTREVLVMVARDPEKPGVEIIEINPQSDGTEVTSMYGEIKPGRVSPRPTVSIQHMDSDWIWQMFGTVRDKFHVIGTQLIARGRFEKENVVLEGRWDLKWLKDS